MGTNIQKTVSIDACHYSADTWVYDVKTPAIPCLLNLMQVTLSVSQLFQGSEEETDRVANLFYWSTCIFLSFCSDTINSFYKATMTWFIAIVAAPCRLPKITSTSEVISFVITFYLKSKYSFEIFEAFE